MKEKPKHIDAFRYFFALTEKGHSTTDAIPVTAEHCGVKPRTVWRWYNEFGWESRADHKRAKIIAEVEKKENKTLAQNRINYLNILHKLLDDLIKADFPVKIGSIKDIDTVVKLCLLLQEAPTEVTKTNNETLLINASDFFDEELIDKIIEEELEAEAEAKEELKARLAEATKDVDTDFITDDDELDDDIDYEEE